MPPENGTRLRPEEYHAGEQQLSYERISMSAYFIADVEVTDESLYAQFRERMTPTMEAYGGKFVARGGEIKVRLGTWTPTRLAILESTACSRLAHGSYRPSTRRSMTFAPGPPTSTWCLSKACSPFNDTYLYLRPAKSQHRPMWWGILDSNQGPQSYQDCALTT